MLFHINTQIVGALEVYRVQALPCYVISNPITTICELGSLSWWSAAASDLCIVLNESSCCSWIIWNKGNKSFSFLDLDFQKINLKISSEVWSSLSPATLGSFSPICKPRLGKFPRVLVISGNPCVHKASQHTKQKSGKQKTTFYNSVNYL